MKEKLIKWGWVCVNCNCPGNPKGIECSTKKHRGYLIKTIGDEHFKLYKNGMLQDSGQNHELEKSLKTYGILS